MPWFKHSCFVSYRHGQHAIKERFINEFCTGLAGELELLRNEGVWVDRERLKSGQLFNPGVAQALYESACMVVIYQPNYFDPEHPYCAREYKAMCELEAARLQLLPEGSERSKGLIIPVVLRGKDAMPPELAANRHYEDFSRFMLADAELAKHPGFAAQLKGIAEYIDGRCKALAKVTVPTNHGFALPTAESVGDWLNSLVLPSVKFPGAEA